jgi:hypothetical protein
MSFPAEPLVPSPAAVVLLVLLPSGAIEATTQAALQLLQQQLGPAIRVLRVDEATHPAVVRSFKGRGLPAWVLMRHGVELWRQSGLPTGATTVALILSKLGPPPASES